MRHWHETTLAGAEKNLQHWFKMLNAVPSSSADQAVPLKISELAKCTVQKGRKSKPAARCHTELFDAAFFGRPLSSRLFVAALQRQAPELAKGCDKKTKSDFEQRLRARTALIKLYFDLSKKGAQVIMENHVYQNDSGYLCGRLLAILDKIHVDAHRSSGGTNSSPANRAYSAASTTPALIFPQLCKLARYHLSKVGGGWARCLEHGYEAETGEFIEGLKQVVAKLQQSSGCSFPSVLSLEEQGRFAIGFYFERCRNWPEAKKKTVLPN